MNYAEIELTDEQLKMVNGGSCQNTHEFQERQRQEEEERERYRHGHWGHDRHHHKIWCWDN